MAGVIFNRTFFLHFLTLFWRFWQFFDAFWHFFDAFWHFFDTFWHFFDAFWRFLTVLKHFDTELKLPQVIVLMCCIVRSHIHEGYGDSFAKRNWLPAQGCTAQYPIISQMGTVSRCVLCTLTSLESAFKCRGLVESLSYGGLGVMPDHRPLLMYNWFRVN